LHLANGLSDDALERAAPTGVDCGDDAFFRIDDKDGSAVGSSDAEEQARRFRANRIALALLCRRGFEGANDVGMNLVQGDEFEIGRAERGPKAAFVFFDVGARVPFDSPKIEDFFAVEIADAAGAGAEAVDEPGNLVEGFDLENTDAFVGSFGPAGGQGSAACRAGW